MPAPPGRFDDATRGAVAAAAGAAEALVRGELGTAGAAFEAEGAAPPCRSAEVGRGIEATGRRDEGGAIADETAEDDELEAAAAGGRDEVAADAGVTRRAAMAGPRCAAADAASTV